MTDRPVPSDDATVLVTEDDPNVRMVVTLLLRRAGYSVVEATTGREAIDVVRERGPEVDVVLLDVMMPVMNGHEALPALRETVPDLPVVFFSGFDENEVAEHLAEPSPYTAFLPKPFTNDELLDEMRRAIASRS